MQARRDICNLPSIIPVVPSVCDDDSQSRRKDESFMAIHAETLAYGELVTWVGTVRVVASPNGIREVELPQWQTGTERSAAPTQISITEYGDPAAEAHLKQALGELEEYFAGKRHAFDVKLDPVGPDFYRRAWDEVARVPYGETRSYGEIAETLGAPSASRAVGAANGANPVAPLVPCHRIVGSDGRLTGYGPGLPLKQILLEMEGAVPADETAYDAWITALRAERAGQPFVLGMRRTRRYCEPGCAKGRTGSLLPVRLFETADEAEAAGYAPCAHCGGGKHAPSLASA
jgi:methylated-DNA-[protein]-cysteine S-methyltransferase